MGSFVDAFLLGMKKRRDLIFNRKILSHIYGLLAQVMKKSTRRYSGFVATISFLQVLDLHETGFIRKMNYEWRQCKENSNYVFVIAWILSTPKDILVFIEWMEKFDTSSCISEVRTCLFSIGGCFWNCIGGKSSFGCCSWKYKNCCIILCKREGNKNV